MWRRSRNDYRHGRVGRARPDRAEFVNACTRPHPSPHSPQMRAGALYQEIKSNANLHAREVS
jgi:hypothetical protein